MPSPAPISWIGFQDASRAISMSVFTCAMHSPLSSAIQNLPQLDQIRADAEDVETHGGKMRRHDPAVFPAVGNDEGRDVQGRAQLLLGVLPERPQVALL